MDSRTPGTDFNYPQVQTDLKSAFGLPVSIEKFDLQPCLFPRRRLLS